METSTTLTWEKRPNGDWVTGNGLYVIPNGKKRDQRHLHWAETDECLSDKPGTVGEMKELAQVHMDQCVQDGKDAVADVQIAPEAVQAVAAEESLSDTQSLVSADPDATADYPSESEMVLIGVEKHSMEIVSLPNVDNLPKLIQEGIVEVADADMLAETLVEGIEDTINPVASPETVDDALLMPFTQGILPSPEQIEEAASEVLGMFGPEKPLPSPTLVWIADPQTKQNETSDWTFWLSECGKYRVYLSVDKFGGDNYFGASVRKPTGVKRLNSEEFGAWDAVDHGRSGFVRYKTLADALEAAAHHFREQTHQDFVPDASKVLAAASGMGMAVSPESVQKSKKAVSEPAAAADNSPVTATLKKPKSTKKEPKVEKATMKITESDARSMCVAVGWKSMGDKKNCPLTKVQQRINATMLANVDDLEEPEHDDDKKSLKRVLEALRKGQAVEVVSEDISESEPEEPAASEAAEAPAKAVKKNGKKAASPASANRPVTKKAAEPGKNGHPKAGAKKTPKKENTEATKKVGKGSFLSDWGPPKGSEPYKVLKNFESQQSVTAVAEKMKITEKRVLACITFWADRQAPIKKQKDGYVLIPDNN